MFSKLILLSKLVSSEQEIIDFIPDAACPPGYWVPPILMTAFLLIANILLMSMLLAIFKFIFDRFCLN